MSAEAPTHPYYASAPARRSYLLSVAASAVCDVAVLALLAALTSGAGISGAAVYALLGGIVLLYIAGRLLARRSWCDVAWRRQDGATGPCWLLVARTVLSCSALLAAWVWGLSRAADREGGGAFALTVIAFAFMWAALIEDRLRRLMRREFVRFHLAYLAALLLVGGIVTYWAIREVPPGVATSGEIVGTTLVVLAVFLGLAAAGRAMFATPRAKSS